MAVDLDFNAISNQIEKTPPITAVFVTLTIILSTVTSYIRSNSYDSLRVSDPSILWEDIVIPGLQVVPAQVVFHPWTLWTATFVEITPHQFIIGLIIMWFGVTWLEEHWNPKYNDSTNSSNSSADKTLVPETFKFLSIVTIFTNLISVLVIIIVNTLITPTPELLSHPLGYGVYNFILPLAVVAKQLQPERNVKLFSKFKFRLKRLPFILLSSSLILSILLMRSWPILPAFVSFLVSWGYLRYFQVIADSSILPDSRSGIAIGDASDTFDMVEFFPEVSKAYLKPFFNACYEGVVLLGVVRPWNDDDVESGNLRSRNRVVRTSTVSNSSSGTTGDERRKQMGLKILEGST